jgi:hypothetical protein
MKETICAVVLYWCGTLSVSPREEGLDAFENKVLRRIFGPETDEISEELRKLHEDEQPHDI